MTFLWRDDGADTENTFWHQKTFSNNTGTCGNRCPFIWDLLPVILAHLPSVSGLMSSILWYYRSEERITGTAAQVATGRSKPVKCSNCFFLIQAQFKAELLHLESNKIVHDEICKATFLASLVLLLLMNLCGLRPQVRDEHMVVFTLACQSYDLILPFNKDFLLNDWIGDINKILKFLYPNVWLVPDGEVICLRY